MSKSEGTSEIRLEGKSRSLLFSSRYRNLGFTVTEDLSKKAREARLELRKYMREVKRKNPEKHCFIEQDKLFIDGNIYTFSQSSRAVVEFRNQQKTWNKPKRYNMIK